MRLYKNYLLLIIILLFINCTKKVTEPTIKYRLITNVIPYEAGRINPSDTTNFEEGSKVTLDAIPNQHWLFDKWTEDLDGNDNPAEIIMDKNKTIIANFTKVQHPLIVNIEGEGIVEEQIVISKTNDYDYGTTVQLTAVADSGWVFDSWDGDAIGNDNPIQILIDTNKTVTAKFIQIFTLKIDITGNGSVQIEPDLTTYPANSAVELTAVADSGWVFDSWDRDAIGNDNPIQIKIDSNKTVTAKFIQTFTITINITGNGSVQMAPDLPAYPINSFVQITALPDNGWIFTGWDGDVQDSSSVINVQIDNDKTFNVIFNEIILPQTTWEYFDGIQQVFINEFGWLNPESLFVRVEVDATPYIVSKLNYQKWQLGNWSNWQEIIATQAQSIVEFDIDISDYEGEGKVQFNALNNNNLESSTTLINYKYDKTAPIFDITAGNAVIGFGRIGLDWTNNSVSDDLSGIGYILIYRNSNNSFSGAVEVGKISIVSQSIIPSSFIDESISSVDQYYYWGKAQDRAGNLSSESRLNN